MTRLYADENFPMAGVAELRRLGHDLLTMAEAGVAGLGMSDPDVLEAARRDARALITLNRRHFIRLHQERPDHCGIVVCTFDPDFIGQAGRIHEALQGAGDISGQLLRVNRAGP